MLRLLEDFVQEQLDAGGPVTQVVVLPALRDVHHVPVFPQPKFGANIHSKEVRKHLHMLPNPASFEAGGYTFACSSLDTMMLLTQQELSRMAPVQPGQKGPDRLGRLASHLVRQRQFLPLFPASADGSIPVDVSACLQRGTLSARPHVLLVPSDLGPFAKAADGGVLALNSGRAARGAGGGTFGFLTLHPPFVAEEPTAAAEAAEAASEVKGEPMEVEEEAQATEAEAPATDGAVAGGAEAEAETAATAQAEPMEGVSEADGTAAAAAGSGAAEGAAEDAVKPEPLPLAAVGAAEAASSTAGAATEAKPDAAAAALVPVAPGGEAAAAKAAEAAQAAAQAAQEAAEVAAAVAAREAEELETAAAHDVFPRAFVEIVRL